MSKQSGLGDNFYIGGYDLSGDIASVDQISGGPAAIEATTIKQVAEARLFGLRSGTMKFTSLFENAPAIVTPGVPASTTPAPNTYNVPVYATITGGTISNVSVNGVTVGTAAGTYSVPVGGNIAITYSAAPTWNWFALGAEHNALAPLPRADEICTYARGTAIGNASACMRGVQLNYDGTRDNTGALTFQAEITADGFGTEWCKLLTPGIRVDTAPTVGSVYDQGAASNYGAQAYLQLIELVGSSIDVAITHSTTSGGTYTSLIDFGSLTAAPAAVRGSVSNTTTVNEFLKVATTGTFSYALFVVAFNQNLTPGVLF